jgi:TPR repeat protein/CHAT domain-containing protein
VRWFLRAAENGNWSSQRFVSWLHENGTGVPRDSSAAFRWLLRAAEAGDQRAQGLLPRLLLNGIGTATDTKAAASWARRAADAGDAEGQYWLGVAYYLGEGEPQDDARAVAWFRKAAASGKAAAQVALANLLNDGRAVAEDAGESRRLLEAAAKQSNDSLLELLKRMPVTQALAKLEELKRERPGDILLLEVRYYIAAQMASVAVARAEAMLMSQHYKALPEPWRNDLLRLLRVQLKELCRPQFSGAADLAVLRRLDALGVPEAALQIGMVHARYAGGAGDREAVAWFRRAAESGSVEAQYELALAFADGRGTAQDLAQAALWYRKAADAGDKRAMNNLGVMHEFGDGLPVSLEEALRWYRRSADAGADAGMYNVGEMLLRGRGAPKDPVQALIFLTRAADKGHAGAQALLGELYKDGIDGVPKDPSRALLWTRKAAEAGNTSGLVSLGYFYLHGTATQHDPARAAHYFRMAADRGATRGQIALADLLWYGRGIPADRIKARELYEAAARGGSPLAREKLDGIAAHGQPDQGDRAVVVRAEPHMTQDGPSSAAPRTQETGDARPLTVSAARAQEEVGRLQARSRDLLARQHWREARLLHRAAADWRLAADQPDEAIAERLRELAINDAGLATFYGSSANYFFLLQSSCQWAQAARWAHRARQPEAALVMAKVAINKLQEARRLLSQLDESLKECFLKEHEDRYRWLADLLVDMGRLAEAEQVLSMLKHFEMEEYVRRTGPRPSASHEFAFTAREQALLQEAGALRAQVSATATANRLGAAEAQRALTAQEQEDLRTAREQVRAAHARLRADMTALLADLRAQRSVAAGESAHEASLKSARSIQGSLRDVFKGQAVVIQSVVLPHRTHLLVTTATTQQVVRVDVDRAALARLVADLRKAVQSPTTDPRPQAQALHRLLIEPLAPLLADARTLMVSADDVLRYVPFAALHDGERFLVERYALSVYNPATRDIAVAPVSRPQWRVAAFGSTREQVDLGFSALPDVAGELRAVVREPGEREGAMPGARRLDADFTRESLASAVRQRYPALHIASHFRLAFGDAQRSVLLLGNGRTLPMADFTDPVDFDLSQVDLVTLSACETAVPAGADTGSGAEVESLSALIHQSGARSVLATLWPVADRATARFMGSLYANLAADAGTSKAEALRMAQVAFIREAGPDADDASADAKRGARRADGTARAAAGTSYPGFSHPYFWAPFNLLGNWM